MAREIEMRLNETVGKRLLNAREAAQYLGLEVDTIYKKPGCASFLRSRLVERCGSMSKR
jgi:predicted DNA-binding transcriptional regulator AlpA